MIQPLQIMPPDLFPPSLQPLIYFTLMPLALILGVVFIIVFWVLIIPEEAKMYIKNKIRKKDMFDVETESGVRFLDTGKIYPEGIAKLDKSKLVLPIPRPIPAQQIKMNMATKGMKPKDIDKIMKAVQEAEKTTLKPSIVKGLGCRIYRVFQSTALATTLATLVGLEYDGNSKTSTMAIPMATKNGKRIEPAKLFIRKGQELKSWVMPVGLPVDPNVIRKWFDPQFSPSQAKAIEYIGMMKERTRTGSALKSMLPYIAIIFIIIVVAIVAVMFLGGGGGQQPPIQ